MSIQSEEVVHFAISNFTACNEHIVGGQISWVEDVITPPATYGRTVLHTAIIEQVTCEKCKQSAAFLKTLEEDYD